MSYLRDRQAKKEKFFRLAGGLLLLLVLFYFRAGIFTGLSYVTGEILRPVLVVGGGAGRMLGGLGAYFSSKKSIYQENENLRAELVQAQAEMVDHGLLVRENEELKEVLARLPANKKFILATILGKPNLSPYDTLLLDIGSRHGARAGDLVYAMGDIPMGRIATITADTSKAVLFSSPREKTQVIVPASLERGSESDLYLELVGRGGGNFEMTLPRDFALEKGDAAMLPDLKPYVVATVETMLSDPRDAFKKALFKSPANLQELRFVEVEIR